MNVFKIEFCTYKHEFFDKMRPRILQSKRNHYWPW